MKTLPTDYVGCTNVTNRHKKLTKGDKMYAFFSALILLFGSLFILFSWMLDVASS